ncbi:unnamed protein product [Bathycoccus prasinos]
MATAKWLQQPMLSRSLKMKARTCAKDLRDSSKAVLSKLRLSASASLRIEKIHWQSALHAKCRELSTIFPRPTGSYP